MELHWSNLIENSTCNTTTRLIIFKFLDQSLCTIKHFFVYSFTMTLGTNNSLLLVKERHGVIIGHCLYI